MAGGGVNADIIPELRAKTGISSFHLSGKILLNSLMVYRNPEMSMGMSAFGEYDILRTSTEQIAAARKVLEEIA
jgi:copper homeostasis protein